MTTRKRQGQSDVPQRSAKKTKTDLAIEEAVARLVANAPPLSEWQRIRIAELFSGVVNDRARRQRGRSGPDET